MRNQSSLLENNKNEIFQKKSDMLFFHGASIIEFAPLKF